MTARPIALTIAGSDSGGGAGIQADLRTFTRLGVHGTSAVVALTAQNTRGVRAAEPVPLAMVEAQLAALAEDLPPQAVKTGMLATAELVRTVARAVDVYGWGARLVVDPVMVATSSDRLLDADAVRVVLDELIPRAALVTPNLDEAALLCGHPVRDREEMHRAGEWLMARGARAVLLKGGHLGGEVVTDLLLMPRDLPDADDGHHAPGGDGWHTVRPFVHARLPGGPFHGTGCTLSAAITARLAHGDTLADAVRAGIDYVAARLAEAWRPGGGSWVLG